MSPSRWMNVLNLIGLVTTPWASGAQTSSKPPEERRFESGPFVQELRRRGLVEMLELYLQENPPRNVETKLDLEREIQRARFSDASLTREERYEALRRSNEFLERLIEERPNDRRRFEWMWDLSHSLVYEEAEPYFTDMLYKGGNEKDRQELWPLTDRALRILDKLNADIEEEFDRLDNLPLNQYESIEQTGHVERLERLEPQARYLRWWALYYNSLARRESDPVRKSNLASLVLDLEQNRWVLETPQADNPAQAPALLLLGLAKRLSGDGREAERWLGQAVDVASAAPTPQERRALWWIFFLGNLERVRNFTDMKRFDDALRQLDQLKLQMQSAPNLADAQLALALTERAVHSAQADQSRQDGAAAQAQLSQTRAGAALVKLIQGDPKQRDSVYLTLYEQMGSDPDPDHLDPIEQAALVAGLLREAQEDRRRAQASEDPAEQRRLKTRADERLSRAVEWGERFAQSKETQVSRMTPEILFNVGVAAYRLGRTGKAANKFLQVAREHPDFTDASKAALLSVQLASDLYQNVEDDHRAAARTLYLDALETLVKTYPRHPDAAYWRFFYGQLLEEVGRFREAADQFLVVGSDHPHALEASFLRARCLAEWLQERSASKEETDPVTWRRHGNDVFDALRDFRLKAAPLVEKEPEAGRSAILADFMTQATLIAAELYLTPSLNNPQKTLETLREFEKSPPADPSRWTGRALRAKLEAYVALKRLEDALEIVPSYVEADPDQAGVTLQKFHQALVEERKTLIDKGRAMDVKPYTRAAVIVARRLIEWAKERADAPSRLLLNLQLGEALIHDEQFAEARKVFEACGGAEPTSKTSVTAEKARARLGLAEALRQTGAPDEALVMFNELAGVLPHDSPLRWRAVLRDLQCRDALGHDPRGILKAIHNQGYPDRTFGGPEFAAEFERLERDCRRRLETTPANP